jgi:hypothetical protein
LLQLALDFVPGALELEFVHINYSGWVGQSVVSDPHKRRTPGQTLPFSSHHFSACQVTSFSSELVKYGRSRLLDLW